MPTEEQSQQDVMTQDEEVQTEEVHGAEESTETDKASITIEKLQKRLGKVTGAKNSAEQALEEMQLKNAELQKQLEEYKQGNTVKELSDKEKAEQEAQAKDDEIKSLKAQLARTQAMQDTNEILKSEGYNVPANVLELIVTDNSEQTVDNVKAVLSFAESIKETVRTDLLKGTAPRRTGTPNKVVDSATFATMTYAEKQKLFNDDPTLFEQLIGGK
ncbi:MAG: DUF4355 domain-containing protein [Bacteroidaceae bacterium]|nr:DUF4355 domain-containing protein [Bacteroidaceae bacterium]